VAICSRGNLTINEQRLILVTATVPLANNIIIPTQQTWKMHI